jgi:NhaP-type Na+/H+ or K+/H+ antiporter
LVVFLLASLVAVVIDAAPKNGHVSIITDALNLFVHWAGVGAVIGLFLGWLVFRVICQIDD